MTASMHQIVATRCQILRLNASNLISAGAPPDLAELRGLLLRAGKGAREGRLRVRKEWKGQEGKS